MKDNNEIEMSCIGCILLDSKVVMDLFIEKKVSDEYFIDPNCHKLYKAMLKHAKLGNIVDERVMANQFKGDKILGASDFYEHAVDSAITRANAPRYLDILSQQYVKRKITVTAREMEALKHNHYANVDELVSEAQATVLGLNRHASAPSKIVIGNKILESYIGARDGVCVGIPSPFSLFDAATGGPRKGLHTMLAGPRGTGKSTIVINWNVHLGQNGIPSAVFAMEDGAERFIAKASACLGGYSEWRMSMGGQGKDRITETELAKVRKCIGKINDMPLYIDGKRGMTIDQIKSKASQYKTQYGIESLWIDGFKDIRKERSDAMVEDARISAGLCDIAESLNIAVISVHHVTKQASKEGNNLVLEDIRGSGVILDDARMVLLLQPDETLDCQKNNFGPTVAIPLDIDLAHCQVSACGGPIQNDDNASIEEPEDIPDFKPKPLVDGVDPNQPF